uniref:phosphoethanolamine N-methyltransferase n=1 Tax=Meloidogyne incognita TaxID=6306 RepID=A0A914LMX3_MELIC
MLPSFKNKFVVDIGAGIGRFTTEFAKKARKVVSTDFVASFIEKNRETNIAFNNIEWRVGDAVRLDFEEGSIDIVFTNWLLMYLVDEEVVQFLINAIKWLRPGGYLHLRESCSEPSSKKSNNSLHSNSDSINPTKYRFSSAYIQLLKSINFKSGDGTVWGFKIHWASSVNVYIQKNANWRQVHWLVSKVPKKEKFMPNLGTLLGEKWPEEQKEWDNKLDLALNENQNITSTLASYLLSSGIGTNSVILVFDLRNSENQPSINVHTLANRLNSNIWSVSLNPFCFRHSLTLANNNQDRRIRHSWHEDIESAFHFLGEQISGKEKNISRLFDVIIGIGLLEKIKKMKDASEKVEKILGRYLLSIETGEGDDIRKEKKNEDIVEYFPSELFTKQTIEFKADNDLISLIRIEKEKIVNKNKNEEQTGAWLPINGGF